MKKQIKIPSSGGEKLLEKYGNEYFKKLAKDGWKKRKEIRSKYKK